MRLKLFILFLFSTLLCLGQESLSTDSVAESAPIHTKQTKKKKRKYSQPPKEEIVVVNSSEKTTDDDNNIEGFIFFLAVVFILAYYVRQGYRRTPVTTDESVFSDRWKRKNMSRRDYYREVYLNSEEWKRKRYVVLRRDNWRCVHCGEEATQVHHKRYAPKNIGKEPIEWLESVCKSCHEKLHGVVEE